MLKFPCIFKDGWVDRPVLQLILGAEVVRLRHFAYLTPKRGLLSFTKR